MNHHLYFLSLASLFFFIKDWVQFVSKSSLWKDLGEFALVILQNKYTLTNSFCGLPIKMLSQALIFHVRNFNNCICLYYKFKSNSNPWRYNCIVLSDDLIFFSVKNQDSLQKKLCLFRANPTWIIISIP
jgi:hypothetical protein